MSTKPAPEALSEVLEDMYHTSFDSDGPYPAPTPTQWWRMYEAAQRLEARNQHLQEQIDDLCQRLGVPCPEGL